MHTLVGLAFDVRRVFDVGIETSHLFLLALEFGCQRASRLV
jgi:hypothetical protein